MLVLALFHLAASLAIVASASVASAFGSSARGLAILLGGFGNLPFWQLLYTVPLILLALRHDNIGMAVGILMNAICVAYLIKSYGLVS